jgi:hypothetical protein
MSSRMARKDRPERIVVLERAQITDPPPMITKARALVESPPQLAAGDVFTLSDRLEHRTVPVAPPAHVVRIVDENRLVPFWEPVVATHEIAQSSSGEIVGRAPRALPAAAASEMVAPNTVASRACPRRLPLRPPPVGAWRG